MHVKAPIEGLGKRLSRHVDLYCLALVVGYGLTRALLNLTYGVAVACASAGLPLRGASLRFPIDASASIAVWAFLLAAHGCRRPQTRLVGAGVVAVASLVLINACSMAGAFGPGRPGAVETALPVVWGMASVVANAAWLAPFVSLAGRRCAVTLSCCILFSSLTCLLVGRFPASMQGLLLVVAGLVSIALFALTHRMHPDSACLPDTPAPPQPGAEAHGRTARLVHDLWGPLLVFVTATVTLGFVSAYLGSNPLNESSPVRNLATIAGAALTAVLAVSANRMFDLRKAFQAIFPALALLLGVLPFAGEPFGGLFQTVLVFLYTVVNASTLFLLVQTARVQGAPVVTAVTTFMGIARACLVASLAVGAALGSRLEADAFVRMLVLALVVAYALSLVLSMLVRGQGRDGLGRLDGGVCRSLSDEGACGCGQAGAGVEASEPTGFPRAPEEAPDPKAPERRQRKIARLYRLSPREAEVAALLAQGRSMPYIADKLGLAGSTVRSYAQEAYVKLDVHSKQEVIDLFTREEG